MRPEKKVPLACNNQILCVQSNERILKTARQYLRNHRNRTTYYWMKNKSKQKIDFLEMNENESTIYPNIWGTINVIVRGKFIALGAFIKKKKLERAYTNL